MTTALRGLLVAVLISVTVALQVSVFSHFAVEGVVPDLALLLVIGAALVRGPTYAALVGLVPLVAAHPILGVAAGALAGMGGNFLLSRRYVFRAA